MLRYKVEGMTCGHCVRAVTEAVLEVDPSARVAVDLGSGEVRVEGRAAAPAARIAEAIAEAGYAATLVEAAA